MLDIYFCYFFMTQLVQMRLSFLSLSSFNPKHNYWWMFISANASNEAFRGNRFCFEFQMQRYILKAYTLYDVIQLTKWIFSSNMLQCLNKVFVKLRIFVMKCIELKSVFNSPQWVVSGDNKINTLIWRQEWKAVTEQLMHIHANIESNAINKR